MQRKLGRESSGPGLNPYSTTVEFFSPNKILVESVTMIMIISFMLFSITILIWKGTVLPPAQSMGLFFGVMLTSMIAVRQYASFR
jgi:hypothetical protein